MNGYDLSRQWFNWCFDNPEKISPNHAALYFFCIEHCNRLGWKTKFGLPSEMAKEAIGIKNYRTYQKTLNDLVDFGFIILVQKSKNQYSSNIIAIVKNAIAHTKALDKALQKHDTKQGKSTASIDKQETINNETKNKYAEFVFLTSIEYQKLISDHKIENTKLFISILDNYKGSTGKKYKSDYRAILSWVIEKTKKENKYKSTSLKLAM